MSEKEFEYPTVEELVEGVEEGRKNVSENLEGLGRGLTDEARQKLMVEQNPQLFRTWKGICLENFNFPGMRMLPVIMPGGNRHQYTELALREHDALHAFFKEKHPAETRQPSIWLYEGFIGELAAMFIRYMITDTEAFTYITEPRNYERVINVLAGEEDPEGLRADQLMFRNNRYWKVMDHHHVVNAIAAPIELPMACFSVPFDANPMDELFDGDFLHLDEVKKSFSKQFHEQLRKATELAQKVGYLVYQKDHDLILSFKGIEKFTKLNIGLDRVYPLLPESGEIEVGNKALAVEDWKENYAANVHVSVKRIITLNKYINRGIAQFRAMLRQHPVILADWEEHVKAELMASSHFMKSIYTAQPEYVHELVLSVANEVMTTLYEHGGNIGLDVNDWTVYSYESGGRPTPLVNPEMRFADKLYKRYTDSFIQALYAYLMRSQCPLIKPYTYREIVSTDDGIAVGTVRQVN